MSTLAKRTKRGRFRPPAIEERPLLDRDEAAQLMLLFKIFANDSRLRLAVRTLVRAQNRLRALSLLGLTVDHENWGKTEFGARSRRSSHPRRARSSIDSSISPR